MALRNVPEGATAPIPQSAEEHRQAPAPSAPFFESFERFRSEIDTAKLHGGTVRRFAELVADVVGGARAVFEIALDDEQREQRRKDADEPRDEDRPLLSANHMWSLQRMAMASLGALESDAERLMKWAFENHTPEGQAEERSFARHMLEQQEVRRG
jgi:hypothetical protein